MTEYLHFLYKEEFWYISAFLNSSSINGVEIAKKIEEFIKAKFKNLKPDDFYRQDLKESIMDMVKNISFKCIWVPYLENFPYRDENSDRAFNTLGYFQFNIEYYRDNPLKKESLNPMLIQQIPYLLLDDIQEFSRRDENEGILLDTDSPVYVFATSNKTIPKEIEWTEENIERYKRLIGDWTEIYSGQWKDYSETLYNKRIENNLSNRLSELHFIRRNSGFVYMKEESYEKFFESYMIKYVLDPTPKMRAVLFALRSINESLDLLFLKTQSEVFQELKTIENKIRNLRLLRGLIQTNLSLIYNELDYNRRQHYTRILKYLLSEFEIDNIVSRINEKFNIIYDAMQVLYQKKNEENQERTEKGLNLLNLLFGAGVLADLAGVIMVAFALQEGDFFSFLLNGSMALIITGILIATIGYYLYMRVKIKKTEIGKAVDAVIEDQNGNVILIKRRYPPFRNFYALPGGFVKTGEKLKQTLVREVKEETNLDVKIEFKVGTYTEEGRDPRGNIHSTAFKCKIIGDPSIMQSGDDSKDVEIVSKNRIMNLELAFDHRKILKDAGILK